MTCVSHSLGQKKVKSEKKQFFIFHWIVLRISTLEAKLDCYPPVRLIIDLHDVNILICLLMVNNYEKLTFLFEWKTIFWSSIFLFWGKVKVIPLPFSFHIYCSDMWIINNDTAINRMLSVKRDLVNWRALCQTLNRFSTMTEWWSEREGKN